MNVILLLLNPAQRDVPKSLVSAMDRRAQILDAARDQGHVLVDSLATELGVSAHTIRRDINSLCGEGKLRRTHGGAAYVDGGSNVPYRTREVLNFHEKNRIAHAVTVFVPDGTTIFISIGTTPALVAHALTVRDGLTVVTVNLNAAMILAENTTNRIIVPGGEIRLPDRDLLNEAAIELFKAYRADFGIFGVGGIDEDGSLLDFHEPEVRARKQIRLNSRRSVLVADHTKFGRRAAAVGGAITDCDLVVIDRLPDREFDDVLAQLGDRLIIARTSEVAQ
jgi:DeoR family glycerol-3-phosphate regulon repressor